MSLKARRRAGFNLLSASRRDSVAEPYPRAHNKAAKEKTLATNPSQPPLIIRGGVKTRLPAFEFSLCLQTKPRVWWNEPEGETTSRLQSFICEPYRQRREPYPKAHGSATKEKQQTHSRRSGCFAVTGCAHANGGLSPPYLPLPSNKTQGMVE